MEHEIRLLSNGHYVPCPECTRAIVLENGAGICPDCREIHYTDVSYYDRKRRVTIRR